MKIFIFPFSVPKDVLRILAAAFTMKIVKKTVGLTFNAINKKFPVRFMIRGVKYSFQILDCTNFIAVSEIFSRNIYSIFLPEQNWVIIDAGSNIGCFTLWANYQANEKCKMVAIEPEPENFKVLSANISSNNISNVTLLNVALGEKEGFCLVSGKGIQSKVESILPDSLDGETLLKLNSSNVNRIKQSVVRIESLNLISRDLEMNFVDLLKMDVEGAELTVLKSANELLESHKIRRIIMETHSEILHSMCENFLINLGYNILLSKWTKFGTGMLAAIVAKPGNQLMTGSEHKFVKQ